MRLRRLDAINLATRKWLKGERLEVGKLARSLGVSRATLFTWVGSRERLYEQVLCSAYARYHRQLIETAEGQGLELLDNVVRKNLVALSTCTVLRAFVKRSPQAAWHILVSPSSAVHELSVQLHTELVERVIAEADLEPQHDAFTLAQLTVRIGGAYVYAPIAGGYAPDVEEAVTAIRVLVSAQTPEASEHAAANPA